MHQKVVFFKLTISSNVQNSFTLQCQEAVFENYMKIRQVFTFKNKKKHLIRINCSHPNHLSNESAIHYMYTHIYISQVNTK